MAVQDKWHLNLDVSQFQKQKHWVAVKTKTLFFLPRKAVCIAEKCFLFGFIEELTWKLFIDIDPDTGSFQEQSWRCICWDVEAECLHRPLLHKMRLSTWISIWRIKVFALKKEIFPATSLAGTIIKIVFEHLITLLMYSHWEVKLINFFLMHTLVIFLHFPGHRTNHKNRKVSPSNRYSMAGTGGHF